MATTLSQNVPVFQCAHFKQPQSFYCNLWQGNPPAVFKMWEHMSSFGKVHSASSPLYPPVFCAMTCRNPVSLGTHVLWICSISFMLFVVKSSKLCLRWSVQSIFSSSRLWLCVCWGVRVIFISCLFSALWISFPSSSSTLSSSVFYFFSL